jgi:hypothetical protein
MLLNANLSLEDPYFDAVSTMHPSIPRVLWNISLPIRTTKEYRSLTGVYHVCSTKRGRTYISNLGPNIMPHLPCISEIDYRNRSGGGGLHTALSQIRKSHVPLNVDIGHGDMF